MDKALFSWKPTGKPSIYQNKNFPFFLRNSAFGGSFIK
jgi:hypothetical protein